MSLLQNYRPTQELSQPSTQRTPEVLPRGENHRCVSDHSQLSSTEVSNELIYATVCLHGVYMKLTFLLSFVCRL